MANEAAREMALKRAASMTPERRSEIAAKASKARWLKAKKHKAELKRRERQIKAATGMTVHVAAIGDIDWDTRSDLVLEKSRPDSA